MVRVAPGVSGQSPPTRIRLGPGPGIDAAVLEELIVLGSQQGIDEICRDFLKGQGASLLLPNWPILTVTATALGL